MTKARPNLAIFDPATGQWMLPPGRSDVALPRDPTRVEGAVPLEGDGGTLWAVPLPEETPESPSTRTADAGARIALLSPKQHAVAELAAKGMSYQEIAQALGHKPETTRTHLRNIYRKLEIASRVELVELFVHAGAASDSGDGS